MHTTLLALLWMETVAYLGVAVLGDDWDDLLGGILHLKFPLSLAQLQFLLFTIVTLYQTIPIITKAIRESHPNIHSILEVNF